jgi:ribonuclease P/MRP protein subunit RPP1
LNALAAQYDILALRPVDEKTLQAACGSLDCDIISLDLTQRFQFHFKFKMLSEAIKLGKKIEICYGQGILGETQSRRNLISNVTQLIRATRARGLIISSEARAAVACRGPWDAINLAAVWGLGQERGYEAMTKEARSAVVGAQLKRTSFRGVVNVVYGGEKPTPEAKAAVVEKGKAAKQKGQATDDKAGNGQKRKSDALGIDQNDSSSGVPLSKTQMKKRAKMEKLKAEGNTMGSK